MGLSPDEFWRLTPRTWEVYVEGYRDKKRLEDYRTGLICAVVANCHRNPAKRPQPFRPQDFMPSQTDHQTPEEQLRFAKLLTVAFGGELDPELGDVRWEAE